MCSLLQQLHSIWETMWEHRNQVKHVLLRPRHKAEVKRLHEEIIHEMQIGPANLADGDRSYFDINLAELLSRSLHYKQAWLVNVTTARQRRERKRRHDDAVSTISQKRSRLIQWIRTGQTSWWSMRLDTLLPLICLTLVRKKCGSNYLTASAEHRRNEVLQKQLCLR